MASSDERGAAGLPPGPGGSLPPPNRPCRAVTDLLSSIPSDGEFRSYYEELAASSSYPVAVRPGKHGKCLIATAAVPAGAPLLLERLPLAAAQGAASAAKALVCSRCLRFLGSPAGQLAHALLSSSSSAGGGGGGCFSAEPEGEEEREGAASPGRLVGGGFTSDELLRLVAGEGGGSGRGGGGGGEGSGLLPRPHPCPGGCSDELYCSPECASADWGRRGEEEEERGEEKAAGEEGRGAHSLLCGGADPSSPLAAAVDDLRELCAATNDSLWLACRALAGVVAESRRLRRRKEKAGLEADEKDADPPADRALLAAWLPWSFAEKALWWEQVSWPPTETETASGGEEAGRQSSQNPHRPHRHHHHHHRHHGGGGDGEEGAEEEEEEGEEEEEQTEASFRASLRKLVRAAASGLSAVFLARAEAAAAKAAAAAGPSSSAAAASRPSGAEEEQEELEAARLAADERLLGCLLGCFELNNLEIRVPPLMRTLLPPSSSSGAGAEEGGSGSGSSDEEGDGGGEGGGGGGDEGAAAALAAAGDGHRPLLPRLVALVGGRRAARSATLFSVRGSAFYRLQSCANHSCAPTARAAPGALTRGLSAPALASLSSATAAAANAAGGGAAPSSSSLPRPLFPAPPRGALPCSALLVAAVDLRPGDEVTICYVDEGQGREERARALRDYGIAACDCRRCQGREEEPAAAASSSPPGSRRRTREEEGDGEEEAEKKRPRFTADGEKKEEEKEKEAARPPDPAPSSPPSLALRPSSSTATPWLGAWRAL